MRKISKKHAIEYIEEISLKKQKLIDKIINDLEDENIIDCDHLNSQNIKGSYRCFGFIKAVKLLSKYI